MTAAGLVAAAVQTRNLPGRPERNLERVRPLVHAAARQGARLVVLPELLPCGYAPELDPAGSAEDLDGPTVATLTRWSATLPGRPVLVTTTLERAAGAPPWNTAVVVGPDGLLGSQRKLHLWDAEQTAFAAGAEVRAVSTPIGFVGVATCYDAGFPEVTRAIAVQGGTVIAVPAAFGRARVAVWDLMTRARALENGCVLVAAGYCGSGGGREFAGHSRVVGPAGTVLADAGEEPGVALARVDPDAVEQQRALVPYLRDLRLRTTTGAGQ